MHRIEQLARALAGPRRAVTRRAALTAGIAGPLAGVSAAAAPGKRCRPGQVCCDRCAGDEPQPTPDPTREPDRTPEPTRAPDRTPEPTRTPQPDGDWRTIWSAGHEGGTMAEWYHPETGMWGNHGGGEFNSDGGWSGATRDQAHSGSWSAQLVRPNGSAHQGVRLFRWRESQTNKELRYSCWYYFPRRYDAGSWWAVMQWKSAGSHNGKFGIAVGNRPDGTMYLFLSRGADSGGGAWRRTSPTSRSAAGSRSTSTTSRRPTTRAR
jgi:hypothetical protein